MPGVGINELNERFDLFAFASFELFNIVYPDVSFAQFKEVNKFVRGLIENMAQCRSFKLKNIRLQDRIDI